MGKAENRIVAGLAMALGISDATNFEVLKTAAEALGCIVADDGTTEIRGDEDEEEEDEEQDASQSDSEPEQPRYKRKRSESQEDPTSSGEDGEEQPEDEEGSGSEDGDEESSDSESDSEIEVPPPALVEDLRTSTDIDPPHYTDEPDSFMQWLVSPVDLDSFMLSSFEHQPVLITRRKNPHFYSDLFSVEEVQRLLKSKPGLQYTFNVDVTNYLDEKRRDFNYNAKCPPPVDIDSEETSAAPEIANADVVWRRYSKEGCSVRILHPQRFCDPLWGLLARLEAFWQCCVGCNAYLTPPASQGFAPHWDDIDAFVIQVEGKKRWRLYAPTDPSHILPRYSSRDFAREELGEMVLEAVLEPGDVLYMPRGTVHEAESLSDSHSLHLTISVNQQRTWTHLLEEALPRALKEATKSDVRLRGSLPRELLLVAGSVPPFSLIPGIGGEAKNLRGAFAEHVSACLQSVVDKIDLDWAADHFGAEFMLHRLPPPPPPAMEDEEGGGGAGGSGQLNMSSHVQLVHPGMLRVMVDTEQGDEAVAVVCHNLCNPRAEHAAANGGKDSDDTCDPSIPPQIEFPIECLDTVTDLVAGEGEAIALCEVTPPEEEAGVGVLEIAQALLDAGLLRKVVPDQR